MDFLNINQNENILIVAPHPDDECIGPGGVLALYPKQCSIIVLTDGREGQGDILPNELKKIRRIEFEQEMKFVGIDKYKLLDYFDGTLLQHLDCLCCFDLSVYSKIFVTSDHDGHPDHTAAYFSVVQALEYQHLKNIEVYLYEVHNPLDECSHMIDITDVLKKKCKMIQFHRSQLSVLAYDRFAVCQAEYRALLNRMTGKYVEVYRKVESTILSKKVQTSKEYILENKLQKMTMLYRLFTKWLIINNRYNPILTYLNKRGIASIAVYGYAEAGEIICQQLEHTGVSILYVMDKKDKKVSGNIKIYRPNKDLPKPNAVIITAVFYYEEIYKELFNFGFNNIISLKDIIDEYL